MAEKPKPKSMPVATRWTPEQYRERPREYDPVVADAILDHVRNGEVLTDVCVDRDMPLPGTFLTWVDEDPSLGERYQKARRIGTEVSFDEAVSVANGRDPARSSIRSGILKWRVERSDPSRYGSRAAVAPRSGDEPTTPDYTSDVRRKLRETRERILAARAREPAEQGEDS